ncbi:divalent metal cation transporter, partial [Myxococcota bacterium]|nr:divalent metal cation transporter [Myxococcota bacterium]
TEFVEMYSTTLGGWARPLVIVAVLTTMLSTILAVMDAVPRTISAAVSSLRGSDLNGKDGKDTIFVASLLGLGVFSIFGNAVFVGSFTIIIDAATIVAFLTAPVLAMLNLRLVTSKSMPEEHRPSTAMRVYASLGIGLSVLFSFYYFAYRLSF